MSLAQVIAVSNPKGGVGKTTLAVNSGLCVGRLQGFGGTCRQRRTGERYRLGPCR